MVSCQQQLPTPFTSSDTRKKRLETYDNFMRKAVSAQTVFDRKKLHEEHEKIVGIVTGGLKSEEKRDVSHLLNIRLWNMLEEEEWRLHNKREESEARLCIYLTLSSLHLVAHTGLLGTFSIPFGNQSTRNSGFGAQIKQSIGRLFWSNDYDYLTKDANGDTLTVNLLWSHVWEASEGNQGRREIVNDLFQQVKECVDKSTAEAISQVLLVSPTGCSFQEVEFLRECCITLGWMRVALVREPSLAAHAALSKLARVNDAKFVSVVVVGFSVLGVTMEVFSCGKSGNEINEINLEAASEGICYLEYLKIAFRRALEQLSPTKRSSIHRYVFLDGLGKLGNDLHAYFRDELKLIQAENLVDHNYLLDAFHPFAKCPDKVTMLWGVSGKAAAVPVTKKSNQEKEPASSNPAKKGNRDAQVAKVKIPLQICTADKETYQIDSGFPVGGKVNTNTTCLLIANCVAVQNGTKHKAVDGIKPGYLIMARTDPEKLTMGAVGSICIINGIGDKVFVGVKFRKPLELGSSGVQIEHVAGKDVRCVKCKGRKSVFIPLEFVGACKDYLFEVQ